MLRFLFVFVILSPLHLLVFLNKNSSFLFVFKKKKHNSKYFLILLANERTEQSKRESSSSPYRTAAPHSIILRPKVLSQSLGFQLDENELIRNNCYYVKYVEGGSASSMAGLKDGDKITKINGKSTSGMSYDEFCNEILIAQQQQQQNKHNMIHLMVMRKSNKSALQQGSSITATAAANTSNITTSTKPTVSFNTSFNNNNNTTTIPINSTSSNLVSVVKVTSPTTPSSALFVDGKIIIINSNLKQTAPLL